MRIAWTIGGALFGRMIFGKLGLVIGGTLGYAMAPNCKSATAQATVAHRPARTSPAGSSNDIEERYPEEAIIDAMRANEDIEETVHHQEEVGSPGREQ